LEVEVLARKAFFKTGAEY